MVRPCLLVALALAMPWTVHAIEMSGLGARAGVTVPEGYGSAVSFGLQLEFAIPQTEFRLVPGLHFWESNGVTDLNPNFDAYYAMKSGLPFDPYMGVGLSVHFLNSNKRETLARDTGGSLFAGARFPISSNELFVEGRYSIADLSQFSIMGGVTFKLP